PALAGSGRDALEAPQLFGGGTARGAHVADVGLHGLVPGAPPRVLHVNADLDTPRRRDACVAQAQVRQTEGRVAEGVAEGEERRDGHVQVLRGVLLAARRAARARVVVVERLLAGGAREGDGEMACGVHVAGGDAGDGVTA